MEVSDMDNYNPVEYWTERGKDESAYHIDTVMKADQEDKMVSVLRHLTYASYQPHSILEIGCGSGRITRVLLNNLTTQMYRGIDISLDRIDRAVKNIMDLEMYQAGLCDFDVGEYQRINTLRGNPNKCYGMIVASQVLLHIKPDEIEEFMKKMIEECDPDGVIIHIDYWPKDKIPNPNLASHNFFYDYEELWSKVGGVIEKIIPTLGEQAIFVVSKKC